MSDKENGVEVLDVQDLEVQSIIAFDGDTNNSFKIHPDGKHFVFPIGNKVTILNNETKHQHFLAGHTNIISAIELSHNGKYIASGQINHIGFRASIIIWDFHTRSKIAEHEIHKVRVEAVTFSQNNRFVISLGGRDCGSCVVYDIENKTALCGARASPDSAGETSVLQATNHRSACFLTGGENTLRLWTINEEDRALKCINIGMSKLKRNIMAIAIDRRDEFAYCGTSTGDLIKIRLNFHHDVEQLTPSKPPVMCGSYTKIDPRPVNLRPPDAPSIRYSKGIRVIHLLFDGRMIIGAGDGEVELVVECANDPKCVMPTKPGPNVNDPSQPMLKSLQKTNIKGTVTSIQLSGKMVYAATINSEVFLISLDNFKDVKLLVTCHTDAIYDVVFPNNFSEVFATASKNDVRVWSLSTKQELLRIKVPNFSCSSLKFTTDGKMIVTGWNDGIIRGFTPLTGRLIFAILNAHNKGCSALSVTSDGTKIISGGCEGQVRVWSLEPEKQELLHVLKEHKGPITAIDINVFNTEAVSSSSDGACIIWDLVRMCRKQIFIRNTLFMCVRYYPTGVQILTGGSDRKVAYWEVYDGSLIRELEGSLAEAINALDISPDGSMFLTGGNDQILKLWKYNEGCPTHVGIGHAGVITAVRFSPDGKFIVSTSGSGDIFIWKCPFAVNNASGDTGKMITLPKKVSSVKDKVEAIGDIKDRCPGIVSEVDPTSVGDKLAIKGLNDRMKGLAVTNKCVCKTKKLIK